MSEWISVAERLPKVNENVIVHVSGGTLGKTLGIEDYVTVDRFDGKEWLGFGEDVIAWMPAAEDNKRDAIYQEWFTEDGQIHAQKMGLLIRCKDCKYLPGTPRLYADDDPVESYIHCGHLGEDGFCSFAKRREE